MLPSFCKQPVTVRRGTLANERGAKVTDWTNPTTVGTWSGSLQPASTSTDRSQPRDRQATESWTCYLPPSADVRAGDRVLVGGRTYAVEGEPQEWQSPTGRLSHIICTVTAWKG